MRRRLPAICALMALVVPGCGGDGDDEDRRTDTRPGSPAAVVKCEGPGPDSSTWRKKATAVGNFGLIVEHLTLQSRKFRNGNYLVKAGAVVEGHQPVTLAVPKGDQGKVGLVYGDAARRDAREPSEALTAITFEPCRDRARSGYVGGLIFDGKPGAVALIVQSSSSTDRLALVP